MKKALAIILSLLITLSCLNVPTIFAAEDDSNLLAGITIDDWLSGTTDHRVLDNAKETTVSRYGGYAFMSTDVCYQGMRLLFSVEANTEYVLTFSAKSSATWEGVAVLETAGLDFSSGKCFTISDKFNTTAIAALNTNAYASTVAGVTDLSGIDEAQWTDIAIEFTPTADSDTYALYLAWAAQKGYDDVIISDLKLIAKGSVPTYAEGNGAVKADPAFAQYGDEVTYTATPYSTSKFLGWYVDNKCVSTATTYVGNAYVNTPTAKFSGTNLLADMTADDWYDNTSKGYENVDIVVDDATAESRYGGTAIKLTEYSAYRGTHMDLPALEAGTTYVLQMQVYHPLGSDFSNLTIAGGATYSVPSNSVDPSGQQTNINIWNNFLNGNGVTVSPATEAGWVTYSKEFEAIGGVDYDLYIECRGGCDGTIFSDISLSKKTTTTVTANVVGNGTVKADPPVAEYGEFVTYTATANKGENFLGWYVNNQLASTSATYSGYCGINVPTAKFTSNNLLANTTLKDWQSGGDRVLSAANAKETTVSRYGGYSFISTSVVYQGMILPLKVKGNTDYVLTFSVKSSTEWESISVLNRAGLTFDGTGKNSTAHSATDTAILETLKANTYSSKIEGVADLSGVDAAKWTDVTIKFTTAANADTYALYLAWGGFLGYDSVIISDLCLKETTTYSIPEISGQYKTQGRTTVENDLLILDQSLSGFEFNAICEGDVKITFDTSYLLEAEYGVYFTVLVDGEAQDRNVCHITQLSSTTFTIAENLPSGEHSFKIYRQNEAACGTIGVRSISLSGYLCEPPKESGLSIEFVGDGVTAGLGNIFNGTPSSDTSELSPLYQDATKTYAFYAAEKLGADFSVIAQNGVGVSIGWQTHTMQDVYTKLHLNKDNLEYDFSKTNDIIVIALGKNDYDKLSDTTEANIKQGFKNLLALVREKNPTSKIIWIYGMQNNKANTAITETISAAGGAANGYYALSMQAHQNISGGNWHPTYTAHKKMADVLVDFINENFYWENKTVDFAAFEDVSIKNSNDDGEQGIRVQFSIDKNIISNGYQGYTVKQIGLLAIKDKYLNGNDLLKDGTYANDKKASVGVFYDAKTGKNKISNDGIASAFLYNIGYSYVNKTLDFADYKNDYTVRCYMLLNDGEKDFYFYDDNYLASILEVMQEIEKAYAKNPSDSVAIANNNALQSILNNSTLVDKNSRTVKSYYEGYQTEATNNLAGEIKLTSSFEYNDPVYTVDTTVVFTNQDTNETITVPAYWNGGKEWIVRYALTSVGDWKYTTYCTDSNNEGLHYVTGSIDCKEYTGDLDIYKKGFLKVEEGERWLSYADGTPFFYLGDTHWTLPMEDLEDANGKQYVNGTYRSLTDEEISALKTKYADKDNIEDLGNVSQFEFIMNYRAEQGYTVIQSQQLGIYGAQGGNEGNTWMADINGDVFEQGITNGMLEKFNTLDTYFEYIAELGFVHAHSQYSYTEELIEAYKHNKITTYQLKKLARYWVARYSAYPVIWATAQEADADFYDYHNIDEDNDGIVDGCYCKVTDTNACQIWYDLMEYVSEYDPYDHPSTAHQEGIGTIYGKTDSYFDNSDAHDFYASQLQFRAEEYNSVELPWNYIKDLWNTNTKPVINYEGVYDGYWGSELSGRGQGWYSYLNGMYGYGYGVQPIFNFFWAGRENGNTYYNPDMTWVDGVYANAADDLGIMKAFFTEYLPNKLGINWWDLLPNFNKTDEYYAPYNSKNGRNYSVATAKDKNNKIAYIGYFAGTETTDLGRFKGASSNTTYYYHWYDTRTGELVKEYTYKSTRSWIAAGLNSGSYSNSGPGKKPSNTSGNSNNNDYLLVVSTTKLSGNIS